MRIATCRISASATFEWFSPVTNRLLVEASVLNRLEHWENALPKGFEPTIGVLNQDNNLQYRGGGVSDPSAPTSRTTCRTGRCARRVSYVTGSHSIKVGMNNIWGTQRNLTYTPTARRCSIAPARVGGVVRCRTR